MNYKGYAKQMGVDLIALLLLLVLFVITSTTMQSSIPEIQKIITDATWVNDHIQKNNELPELDGENAKRIDESIAASQQVIFKLAISVLLLIFGGIVISSLSRPFAWSFAHNTNLTKKKFIIFFKRNVIWQSIHAIVFILYFIFFPQLLTIILIIPHLLIYIYCTIQLRKTLTQTSNEITKHWQNEMLHPKKFFIATGYVLMIFFLGLIIGAIITPLQGIFAIISSLIGTSVARTRLVQ